MPGIDLNFCARLEPSQLMILIFALLVAILHYSTRMAHFFQAMAFRMGIKFGVFFFTDSSSWENLLRQKPSIIKVRSNDQNREFVLWPRGMPWNGFFGRFRLVEWDIKWALS